MNERLQCNSKTLALALLWLLSLSGISFLARRPAPTPIEITPPPRRHPSQRPHPHPCASTDVMPYPGLMSMS